MTKRSPLLAATAVYALVLLAASLAITRWASLTPLLAGGATTLADEEQQSVLAALHAATAGRAPPPATPRASAWNGRATLWCAGHARARVALHSAARRGLITPFTDDDGHTLDPLATPGCRWKIDVEIARAPILPVEPLFALSLAPGLDGLGVRTATRDLILAPDDLLAADLLTGARPIPGAPDVELGLDARRALQRLFDRSGEDLARWRKEHLNYFRVRYASFIETNLHDVMDTHIDNDPSDEAASHHVNRNIPIDDSDVSLKTSTPIDVIKNNNKTFAITPLIRGHRAATPPVDAAHLQAAAVAAGRYLVRHQHDDGRFDYEYYPLLGAATGDSGDYSLPRHDGATILLAQLAGATSDPAFTEAARRALAFLTTAAPEGCEHPADPARADAGYACVGLRDDATVDLGASALALIAAVEYQRATSDHTFDPWAHRLANFLRAMARSDGSFAHIYTPRTARRDDRAQLLYYSGEATLALARLALLDSETTHRRDPEAAALLDRALHHLTVEDYDFFAGTFFFGEDHWTCQAVESAWPLLDGDDAQRARREQYARFCASYARFLERAQYRDDEGPVRAAPDLAGAYGITPFSAPHTTPAGSRSEVLLAILHLATLRHDADTATIARRQLAGSLHFLLGRQLDATTAFAAPDLDATVGGFLMNDGTPRVRIDFQQHAGCALLRAAHLQEAWGSN